MTRIKAVVSTIVCTLFGYAHAAWAVKDDGSLGAGFIAAVTSAATNVWLPAILGIGFVLIIGLMVLGRGGAFLQKFGYWILAIIVVGGGFTYFAGFSGGTVTMTFLLRGF